MDDKHLLAKRDAKQVRLHHYSFVDYKFRVPLRDPARGCGGPRHDRAANQHRRKSCAAEQGKWDVDLSDEGDVEMRRGHEHEGWRYDDGEVAELGRGVQGEAAERRGR